MNTQVVEMTKGSTVFAWLCSKCQDSRSAAGWTVKPKHVVAWGCDDCSTAEQLAPGYTTPTVDFVPTTPDAFCPAPGWKRDAPIAPWAAAEKRRAGWRRIETEFLGPALEAIEPKGEAA